MNEAGHILPEAIPNHQIHETVPYHEADERDQDISHQREAPLQASAH
jgi:hypothetical protein